MSTMFGDTRGVSEVMGAAVLISMVLIAVTATMTAAAPVLDQFGDQTRFNAMQNGLQGFNGGVHSVATADSPQRTHSFGYKGRQSGQILSLVESGPRVTIAVDGVTVYDAEIGRAFYQPQQSDRSISYEGGGVFRAYSEASTGVEQEPALTFTNRSGEAPTATLPIYDLEGHAALQGNVLLTRANHTNLYPATYAEENVSVVVYSEYASAWADYLNATAPPSAEVTCVAPPGETPRTRITLAGPDGVYVHAHEYDIVVKH